MADEDHQGQAPLTDDEVAQRSSASPSGIALSSDMKVFLTEHPLLADRRLHLDHIEVATLVLEGLCRRGMDREVLMGARLVWVGSAAGCPELYLIRAGIEA